MAELVDGAQHAADVVVGLLEVAGVDLHHVGEQLPALGVERVPGRYAFVAGRQLRVRWHDAELLLPR